MATTVIVITIIIVIANSKTNLYFSIVFRLVVIKRIIVTIITAYL